MRNLNLLFNKEYYSKLGKQGFAEDVIAKNRDLANAEFDGEKDYVKSEIANQVFHLRTTYPGLLVGSGYMHDISKICENDDAVKMGFSFDYVTGQPYIPGSSVKGVLRSHFKNHPEAVADILNNNGNFGVSKDDVANLEKMIFDNSDVFLDAVVYDGNKNKKLIGFDYITPHKEVTQNPKPIKMIKVLPDVCFEFRFVLSDREINGKKLSAGKLKWIFIDLLCIFGAGAKTNVGYGCFSRPDDKTTEKNASAQKESSYKKTDSTVKKADYKKNSKTGNVNTSEKVECPHCNAYIFKYYKNGYKRKECYKCGKPLK